MRTFRCSFMLFMFCLLTPAFTSSLAAEEMKSVEDMFGSEVSEEDYYRADRLMLTVATKSEMTMEEAPAIVSVITGDEIKNMGARSTTDVLRTLPGFDLTHVIQSTWHKVEVRGLSSDADNIKIKLLMNGHPVHNANGSISGILDRIPLGNIKQIEIIRGPGSALYGTGAFIGVINIVTKEGGDEPSKVAMGVGSQNTTTSYGEFSYKEEDFKLYLYADYLKTDGNDGIITSDSASTLPGFLASSAPGEMTGDEKDYNFQTRMSYKGLSFSGYLQRMDGNNPIGIAKALADEDEVKYLYGFAELAYKFSLSDKGNVQLKTSYDYYDWEPTWEIYPEETAELPIHTGFPIGESIKGSPRFKGRVYSGEVMADYKIHSSIDLVAGISHEKWEVYDVAHVANANVAQVPVTVGGVVYNPFPWQYFPGGMTDISEDGNWSKDAKRQITAVYLQGILNIKDLFSLEKGVKGLSLTAGARYDYYDDVGSSINPRLGIVYYPMESLYFKCLYGTAFRAPSFGELNQENNPALTGNPDLEPEEIETMEILVGYHLSKDIKTNITFFQINTTDQIQASGTSYANLGEMESRGIEGELKIYFGRYKYGYCNFTYQDVKNTTGLAKTSAGGQVYTQDDYFPGSVPEYMFNIGMNYDINKYVFANVSLNYVGKRERSEEMNWVGETLTRIDTRDPVSERTLVNAALTFKNFYKGMEFQVSGFNLFDSEHRDPEPDGSIPDDMPQLGRWFTGMVSYTF